MPPPTPRPQAPAPAKGSTRAHAGRVYRLLSKAYPEALCALEHRSPFELLAATILSAQCTDVRVNLTTPALFAAFPTPTAMAAADVVHLEQLVQSTGFFRSKSRHLQAMAQQLVERHGGAVPQTMPELTSLPGVARKTANVVLGVCFGLAVGVVVDTHVLRLAKRLGLTQHDDPKRVEQDLMALYPRKHWIELSHRLIAHGRALCLARTPRCTTCPLGKVCPSFAPRT